MDRIFADLNNQLSDGEGDFLSTFRLRSPALHKIIRSLTDLLLCVAGVCIEASEGGKTATICPHFDAHMTQIWPVIQPHLYFFLVQRANKCLSSGLTRQQLREAADISFALLVYLTASLPEIHQFTKALDTPSKSVRIAAEDGRMTEILCRLYFLQAMDGGLCFTVASRKAAVIDPIAYRLGFRELPAVDNINSEVVSLLENGISYLGGDPNVLVEAILLHLDHASSELVSSQAIADKIHQLQTIYRTSVMMSTLICDDAVRLALTRDHAVGHVTVAVKSITVPVMSAEVAAFQLMALGQCCEYLIRAIDSPMDGCAQVLEALKSGIMPAFAQLNHSSSLYELLIERSGPPTRLDFFGGLLPSYLVHPPVLRLAADELWKTRASGMITAEGTFGRILYHFDRLFSNV